MAILVIPLTIMASIMVTLIHGQNPQQDGQQQSGSCVCPSNSGFLTGPAGPPGPSGGSGLPGVQGPQGVTGPAGDPGLNGIPGVPGQSPSHNLKGDKGDIGQGSRGQPGDPGHPGQKGDQGLDGMPGPRGSPGKVGPQGIMGIQGMEGNQGQSGVKGEKGEAGISYRAPPMSAFSATRTAVMSVTYGSQIITFNREDLDVGDDFNPSTGVFTCRIQGLYYFSFAFIPNYSHDVMYVQLQQNGNAKAAIYYSSPGSYVLQSQGVILSLQVGDEVVLRAHVNTYIRNASSNDNIFNGYLIHAT